MTVMYIPNRTRSRRTCRSCWQIAAALAVTACSGRGERTVLVLDGASVYSAEAGQFVPDQRIVIQDGRITAVGSTSATPLPGGADVLDMTGKWIIPGLIDAHVHAEPWALTEFAAWGVTAIRDLHSDSTAAAALLNRSAGEAISSRIYTSSGGIDGEGSAFDDATQVATDRDARRAVGARALGGADWIAIYTRLTPQLFRSIDAEAEAFKMPIAGYVGAIDAVTAARLGARTIEGLTGIIEATAANRAHWARAHRDFYDGVREVGGAWATVRNSDLDRVADRLAATQAALVPTLVTHESYALLRDTLALMADMPLARVPGFVRTRWNIPGLLEDLSWDATSFLALRAARQKHSRFIARFRAGGGIVVAGSGAIRPMVPPGVALHRELELLVQAGLTPAEALAAATQDAAEGLMLDSLGTISLGKVGDLVVLDADPTINIANTRRISGVVLRGRYYTPDEIRTSR